MECSGRTQPSAPGWAERSPQRIDFGQGNALTTSGTSLPITSMAGRPGFSITAT